MFIKDLLRGLYFSGTVGIMMLLLSLVAGNLKIGYILIFTGALFVGWTSMAFLESIVYKKIKNSLYRLGLSAITMIIIFGLLLRFNVIQQIIN